MVPDDANGSLTGDGLRTYAYDVQNRLISATAPGKTATYDYDPLGRRSAKTVDGFTTEFFTDGDQEIIDYENGVVQRRYIKPDGGDGEKVKGGYTIGLIFEKMPPSERGWPPVPYHIFCDR